MTDFSPTDISTDVSLIDDVVHRRDAATKSSGREWQPEGRFLAKEDVDGMALSAAGPDMFGGRNAKYSRVMAKAYGH